MRVKGPGTQSKLRCILYSKGRRETTKLSIGLALVIEVGICSEYLSQTASCIGRVWRLRRRREQKQRWISQMCIASAAGTAATRPRRLASMQKDSGNSKGFSESLQSNLLWNAEGYLRWNVFRLPFSFSRSARAYCLPCIQKFGHCGERKAALFPSLK